MNIPNSCSKEYKKSELKKINKYAKQFYDLSVSSLDKVNDMQVNREVSVTSTLESSSFISEPIRKYINETKKITYKFNAMINQKNVTLYFTSFNQMNDKKITFYSKLAFMIIFMLTNKSKNSCSKNLEIKIFLTPHKKLLPPNKTDILGPNEVNTGFSTIGCRTHAAITIYREEEWFKVLIHELFHNLDLDFSDIDINESKKNMYEIFKLQSEYEIAETYTEMWARIINVVVSCTIKSNSYDNFFKLFIESMERERLFTLKQAAVILDRITSIKEYREESNIFCYYILTAALFNNYLHFIEWCDKHNAGLLKFKKMQKNIKSFVELILTECDHPSFKSNLSCVNKSTTNRSLMMTITSPF